MCVLLIDKTRTVARPAQTGYLAVFDDRALALVHLVVKGELFIGGDRSGGEEGQTRKPHVCGVDPT